MIFVKPVQATCPVCVVAVGGGLWLAEKLGIDDLVVSIWIGALITASAVALGPKFKLIKLPKPALSWTIIFYLLSVLTLQIQGKLNSPYCQIWGVCKIWLGITIGTVVLWLGNLLDQFLRTKSETGKAFFPFQKVIIPFVLVLLASLAFYLAIC